VKGKFDSILEDMNSNDEVLNFVESYFVYIFIILLIIYYTNILNIVKKYYTLLTIFNFLGE
jgi:hypothetical protein